MGWFSVPPSHSSESLSVFSWLGCAKLGQIRELLRCNPPKLRCTLRISQATVNTKPETCLFPFFLSFTNQPTSTSFQLCHPLLCKAHVHSFNVLFTAASIAWICVHSFFFASLNGHCALFLPRSA